MMSDKLDLGYVYVGAAINDQSDDKNEMTIQMTNDKSVEKQIFLFLRYYRSSNINVP